MPLKIPGVGVVEGHRPDWVKERFPNAKDTFQASQLAVVLPRQSKKPPIRLRAPSPANRFPSLKKVNEAIEATSVTTSHGQVLAQIQAHLAQQLPASLTRPAVILIGETHGSSTALSMTLSALGLLRKIYPQASAKLLLERDVHTLSQWIVPVVKDQKAVFESSLSEGKAYARSSRPTPASRRSR